ncbi:MBL fold metallo-hydrolase [Robertkochia marina]|uniref:MBL fold metallo-hydrolase n=1 Tax=Robertkochia marina TaxID=1227945 RepID=A0A4S3M2F9_9FLAO|nr:MBL fold metallo-hydrolase [Robertkochia marina]THD68855.1 MBL fold metallo-hydrolase [Robertkochia marina]
MKVNTLLPLIAFLFTLTTACNSEKMLRGALDKQVKKMVPPEFVNDEEGITVVMVGTGTPLPGERAQTGTAIFANGYFFLFDIGAGVVQQCENSQLPLDQLNGVFLTHYHSDHMLDLPNVINRSWALGRAHELNIYGPTGLNRVVKGANDFLAIENQYRVDHHGPEIMDISKVDGIAKEFSISENEEVLVFDQDGVKVTAFDVNHDPIRPAVGYVIEYQAKKVVLSGDTAKNEMVEKMAQNCDLLIHEVMLMDVQEILSETLANNDYPRRSEIVHDIQNYHTSPSEVAAIANNAGVKKLVLNHLAPAPENWFITRLYKKELKAFDGPFHLAKEGDVFTIK